MVSSQGVRDDDALKGDDQEDFVLGDICRGVDTPAAIRIFICSIERKIKLA